jgi:low temperature requirement protein LtrA
MSNSYPRETIEPMAVTVTVGGVIVTTGVSFDLTTGGNRPAVWTAALAIDGGGTGVLIDGLDPGTWTVFAKVGTVVIECGSFEVT